MALSLGLANIYEYQNRTPEVIIVDTGKNATTFWENIQKKNPTYRDAYLVLSEIKKQQGDVLSAEDYKSEAQQVDPFFNQTSLQ